MMPEQLAWSQACENNKAPILDMLRRWFPSTGDALDIGAATGQRAVFFAQQLPRDVDNPRRLGGTHGLILAQDVAMPANNRSLVWRLGRSWAGGTDARSTRLSR